MYMEQNWLRVDGYCSCVVGTQGCITVVCFCVCSNLSILNFFLNVTKDGDLLLLVIAN